MTKCIRKERSLRTYEYPKLGLSNLTMVEREMPRPALREVVVKLRAVSLNYRDLLFARGSITRIQPYRRFHVRTAPARSSPWASG